MRNHLACPGNWKVSVLQEREGNGGVLGDDAGRVGLGLDEEKESL